MSLGLLEAMAGGLPAVVGSGPGNPEAVGSDAGLVVEPGDAEGLAEALSQLASDSTARKETGKAARARVRDRFSLDQMLEGVDAAYKYALGVGID